MTGDQHTVVARVRRTGARLTITLDDLAGGSDEPLAHAVVVLRGGHDAAVIEVHVEGDDAALAGRLLAHCADEARARGCRRLLVETGLRGLNAEAGLRGPNAQAAVVVDLDR